MTHWHDHNPWAATLCYITPEDADALLQDCYLDDTYWQNICEQYGPKLDAYLLPQPEGRFSFGIRYGAEGSQYLSPMCKPATAQKIYDRNMRSRIEED